MLQASKPRICVECGLPYGHADFTYQSGKAESGPAYWSDRGLLCSSACSTVHFERRVKEGDPMKEPAPDPFERG